MFAERSVADSALQACCSVVDGLLPEILAGRRRGLSFKEDNSPVTNADVALQEALANCLQETLSNRVAIVGEEGHAADLSFSDLANGDWLAVIDPIDGTENFSAGLPLWGVSLSLWRLGEHVSSLLYLPELGWAMKTGDVVEQHESRIAGFSSSITSELLSKIEPGSESRIAGCAVFNLFCVITGRFSSFANPKGAYSWDLLAGLQLALENNCYVEVDGRPYNGEYLGPSRKYRVYIRK